MKIGWYHSEERSPSDILVDRFPDSKFSIDRWSSFAREIIQNSLDAQDDYEKPVFVEFDLNKTLSLSDIPGGERCKEILVRCRDAATNPHTKSTYEKGLSILSKEKVYCLKVSDRNTKGVKSGRDEAWGALVYDEGKSVKQRAGSAGSHGVGKKAPFIISSCRTVFYATKNKYEENGTQKSDSLVQGKSILINWFDEENTKRNLMGWYGLIDEDTTIPNDAIKPLNREQFDEKYSYFVRKDDYGTDVIIVGVNAYGDTKDNKEALIQKKIINAVIESFFIAVLKKKLVVKIFGVEINAENIEDMLINYYEQPKSIKSDVKASLRVYKESVVQTTNVLSKEGEKIGEVNIYFELGNEFNKKYYSIVRSHGMKILDKRLQKPNQPFTAVAVIEGEVLNSLLSSLENAAHDDFITNDEEVIPDPKAVYALKEVEKIIADYIVENTKIDSTEGQEITGIGNIITLPGIIANIKKKPNVPVVKKRNVAKRSKGALGKGTGKGVTGNNTSKKTGKKQRGKNNGNDSVILYEDYKLEPVFIKTGKKYTMKVAIKHNVANAEFVFKSVNSEGNSDGSIGDFITDLTYENGQRISVKEGMAKGVKMAKDKAMKFILTVSKDVAYRMRLEMYCKEGDINE